MMKPLQLQYRENTEGIIMSVPSIKLTDLEKSYGKQAAVKNIQLEVPKGELFGFLRPNGAGKKTTIKMMKGLLEPTNGSVEIYCIDIWKQPIEAKKRIADVPHH